MQINNRPALSGTIVVAPDQRGSIALPWGIFALTFHPNVTPQKITLHADRNEIEFFGIDNPLGTGTVLELPQANGSTAILNLAVYGIGEGAGAYRIVHFTVAQ